MLGKQLCNHPSVPTEELNRICKGPCSGRRHRAGLPKRYIWYVRYASRLLQAQIAILETTSKVITERRMNFLRDFATKAGMVPSIAILGITAFNYVSISVEPHHIRVLAGAPACIGIIHDRVSS